MGSRDRTIIYGVLIGAATGLLAALLLNRRAAEGDGETHITTGDGLKLGVILIGLLRAVSSLGDHDKE